MRTVKLAALALSLGTGSALADDASLRNWQSHFVYGLNMGPNAPYAQQRRGDAATDRQQTGGTGQASSTQARPSRPAGAARAVARQQQPRRAR